jgi:hypothetical protein
VTPEILAEHVAGVVARRDGWVRAGFDGAPAAGPGPLADAVGELLRLRGRPTLRVSAWDFLRPASVRLEHGRDADAFYWGWFDEKALRREVLDPLGPDGGGRVLPTLWDAERDRATRAGYVDLPPGGVLLLDGPLLVGSSLTLDVTVHLRLSPAALRRRTPEAEHWTLPAYERYDAEALPQEYADVVVRWDDPRHPALVERPAG